MGGPLYLTEADVAKDTVSPEPEIKPLILGPVPYPLSLRSDIKQNTDISSFSYTQMFYIKTHLYSLPLLPRSDLYHTYIL